MPKLRRYDSKFLRNLRLVANVISTFSEPAEQIRVASKVPVNIRIEICVILLKVGVSEFPLRNRNQTENDTRVQVHIRGSGVTIGWGKQGKCPGRRSEGGANFS